MTRTSTIFIIFILFLSIQVNAADYNVAYTTCPAISDTASRLSCFDSYAPQITSGYEPLFGFGIDGLTSHEPNKLLGRTDSQDDSEFYMDATLSVKNPVLTPVVDQLAKMFDIDQESNIPRLYLAFTTRFSQYIGSRPSAPVVARRYNPELFMRVWRDGVHDRTNPSYWDFGYGHESNGQRISNSLAFQQALDNASVDGLPAISAREGISRGWDYLSVDWHKQWNTPLLFNLDGLTETHVEYRHYLGDGIFQGKPEEYNDWEGDGLENRPRSNYNGLILSLQYNLRNTECNDLLCFDKVEVIQQTGYARPFQNNSTQIELTTNFAGLPFYLWARSGYNSDLVNYFKYTNSWGVGFEFYR